MSTEHADPGHGHSPAAWTSVTIMLIAVTIGTVAFFLDVVWLVWASAVLLLIGALRSKDQPGDDPWGGHTLEWATSSPPPAGNFASLPEIASEAPLYDARRPAEEAPA